MAGKGDAYRRVDKKKFDENYERIFAKNPLTGENNGQDSFGGERTQMEDVGRPGNIDQQADQNAPE